MRECQAVIARIPLPLPLLCHCSPQRCYRRRCCGDASTGAARGEKQFQQILVMTVGSHVCQPTVVGEGR